MSKVVLGGALCAALVGCGSNSAEYSAFDAMHVRVERDAHGDLALMRLTIAPSDDRCRWTKWDLAWKHGAPAALLARRREACVV